MGVVGFVVGFGAFLGAGVLGFGIWGFRIWGFGVFGLRPPKGYALGSVAQQRVLFGA